jgi:hypothetical protein
MVGFIDDHREAYGVEPICGVLPIAPSTYFRRLRAFRLPIRVPLRRRRPVCQPATPRGGIPTQLSRDSRRRPATPPSDLTYAELLRVPDCDVFTLSERQIASRERDQTARRHAAIVAEPLRTNGRGYARRHSRDFTRQPEGDRLPKLRSVFASCYGRPSW